MNKNANSQLTGNARALRKSMTPQERKLWYEFLKGLPNTFNRQKVFGNYILDFYCAQAKIAIELDGSQHYDDSGRQADKERDAFLYRNGITVIRYSNADINNNFSGVCRDILRRVTRDEENTSSVANATASPQGEAK